MKGTVVHVIAAAVGAPNPDKVYGAKVAGFRLIRGGKVEIAWKIFARKLRKKQGKKPAP